jgi:hypothetical protein
MYETCYNIFSDLKTLYLCLGWTNTYIDTMIKTTFNQLELDKISNCWPYPMLAQNQGHLRLNLNCFGHDMAIKRSHSRWWRYEFPPFFETPLLDVEGFLFGPINKVDVIEPFLFRTFSIAFTCLHYYKSGVQFTSLNHYGI